MPIKIIKQKKETSQDVAKRFIKTVKKSGMLLELRKKSFQTREKSHTLKKRNALIRLENKAKYESLRKMGKI